MRTFLLAALVGIGLLISSCRDKPSHPIDMAAHAYPIKFFLCGDAGVEDQDEYVSWSKLKFREPSIVRYGECRLDFSEPNTYTLGLDKITTLLQNEESVSQEYFQSLQIFFRKIMLSASKKQNSDLFDVSATFWIFLLGIAKNENLIEKSVADKKINNLRWIMKLLIIEDKFYTNEIPSIP